MYKIIFFLAVNLLSQYYSAQQNVSVNSTGYRQKKSHDPMPEGTGRWTGTLSFDETIIYSNAVVTGKTEKHIHVSFSDALPTMYRDGDNDTAVHNPADLDFTDDKGPGTYSVQGETTSPGGQKCKFDCAGGGVAELHAVVINEETNTYDIEAIGPACNGTETCTGEGTKPYGPDRDNEIIISDHKLLSKDVLSGTETTNSELPNGFGTVTKTISWSLMRSKSGGELIVTPEDYDNWLPEPGKDELTKGSVIKISLMLFGKNGQPSKLKARSFKLRLSNTSKEPGITLNAPLVPGTPLPDLRFLPQVNAAISEEFQLAEVKCNNGVSADISIGSYDGGGYTTLTVEAILDDNSHIEGHLLISGGNTKIPIPKRPDGSNIGASWLGAHRNPHDADDNESSMGNTNDGDGLSAYEEYRGVISEGKFKRLDPEKKELGIKFKRGEYAQFAEGVSKFENASGIKVIPFDESEIGADRNLNKNFLTAHVYDQFALFLQKGTLTGDLGKSFGGPGIPKQVSKTVIDENKIKEAYLNRLKEAIDMNTIVYYSEKDLFATVTAHELSHSVNVPHHGSLDPNSVDLTITADKTTVRIFDYKHTEILTRKYTIKGRIGDIGNEQSGDVDCFMVNNSLCDWVMKTTPDSVFFYEVPLIPLGTKLCNKKDGTGLNMKDANGKNDYFGDATNGNCLSLIKLK